MLLMPDLCAPTAPFQHGRSLCGSAVEQEEARLRMLYDLDLIDTPENESFDRITRMASRLFQAPVSAVSLTDRHRQWFKSHVGTEGREIPRDGAPCAEVTRSASSLVIPDMLLNQQFSGCLLAQAGIRFYAGAPLVTRDGYVLGAMCVLDQKPRTITESELASLQDFAAMVMSQIELQHDFGRIDPLSGLPNRNQLIEDLQDWRRDTPDQQRTAILIDLAEMHHLNQVLNALGTKYVDDLVKACSSETKKVLGRKTGIYHVSTTAFAVLLVGTEAEEWQVVVNKLLTHFQKPMVHNGVPVTIQAAFGVAPFRLVDSNPHDVLRMALNAVHDAREAETDFAVYSSTSDQANRRRFTLLTDLPEALQQSDQFALFYQPRVDVRTGVCVSAEALLRWHSPGLGNVSPGEFIPLVEQTALARPVTQWVLATALEQVARWDRRGIDIRVSINISARNLEEPDFTETVVDALHKYAVSPHKIELEFTESALIRNRSRVLAQLDAIRSLGIELAIDDFGTGYSTFSYLHKLPANIMKIDQSFIRTLATSPKDQVLVRSMITMAHDMGYRVVAEGVETADVYSFLAATGCDEVQGYYFSRPLPTEAFEKWLRQGRDHQTGTMLSLLGQAQMS